VYRHFASKAELLDAVLGRWLSRMNPPLTTVVESPGPAGDRLWRWLTTLMRLKHDKARTDPDLFAAYALLAAEAREVVPAHVGELVAQVTRIVADGIERGEFAPGDPAVIARGVLDATTRFHHPAHAGEWAAGPVEQSFEALWNLLLLGLSAR
jgi:AcrR family transcriptional regulator